MQRVKENVPEGCGGATGAIQGVMVQAASGVGKPQWSRRRVVWNVRAHGVGLLVGCADSPVQIALSIEA